MEDNKRSKQDIFSPKIFFLESPIQNKYIKSIIFQNYNDEDKSNNNNINKNIPIKNKYHRRSLTPHNGNFLLNQIGYIKNDNNYENKKQNEEKKKLSKINSPRDINKLVNKLISHHNNKYNFQSCTKRNTKNENLEIKEKNCTEDKFIKAKRKYTYNYKRVKKSNIDKKNNLKNNKNNRYDSSKNIEISTFDLKKSKENKSSLSFADVDEENNEEDSNDNNNDSSYISKIESKHVSMYDIDEELKELKEIGNDLKSPVYGYNNRNYNRLISSFSINNNDNENENNDNTKQTSILLQLKKMASKNDNENKVNHNPIVFGDNLELSFHENQNKTSIKIQNSSSQKIMNYTKDKHKIKKCINLKNDNQYISKIENIKNKKFCFFFKNDRNVVKKNNIEILVSIEQIEKIRKRNYNINNFTINYMNNYDKKRNSKKAKKNNVNGNNKNINKNSRIENKTPKKELILRNKKESINKINNLSKNSIKKENIFLKNNNYCIKNTNELNKLIKEKIDYLSMKNSLNPQQVQYPTTTTNKNREENKINLNFINTSLNSQRDLSFNNNDLLMIRENDVFCYGGEKSNNNKITYNRFYNGNNITMNNFYNNYKLNDSNNNICYNTEIINEKEIINSKNNDIINAIKNKLALKLKEEINKNKKCNLSKNYKTQINNDYMNLNENYYKCSSKEDLVKKKYSKKNLNGLINNYNDKFIDNNLSKCSSEIINQKNNNNYSYSDNYFNNIDNESYSNNIFLKLNPIIEQKVIEKRKNKSISINKKCINKKNISSEIQLLNKGNKNINKKLIINNNKNFKNKSKFNNPINNINLKRKKANNISDKKNISKNKNLIKNNNIHFLKDNNIPYNKNYIHINNDYELENNNSHNNSVLNNKKHNTNIKSFETNSKSTNINKCSSGEIINYKLNKINGNYNSSTVHATKNALTNFRNNRLINEKHSNVLTKNIMNERMNLDLNDYNPSVRHIESSYKLHNKNNTKSKINLNRISKKYYK